MRNRDNVRELKFVAEKKQKELNYWLKKLSGEIIKVGFPYDRSRDGKNEKDTSLQHIQFEITGELFDRIVKISGGSHVRVYVTLLTGVIFLLWKYTSSKDIIIGSPIFKQNVEGPLINRVLALRNGLESNMSGKELVLQVGMTVFEAIDNQNYPIRLLLDKLGIASEENGFPLFDVAVLLENIHEKNYLHNISTGITFSFHETGSALEATLEYDETLFEPSTVQPIAGYFKTILHQILFNIDTPLSEIEILSAEDKKQLIHDFNDNHTEFSSTMSICHLFQQQAVKNPDRLAVVCDEVSLTYGVLNRWVDSLTNHLSTIGVREDRTVGILLERSLLMVGSILAVWKAGGAYIPLEPGDPELRIIGILKDADSCALISKGDIIGPTVIDNFSGIIIDLQKLEFDHTAFNAASNPELEINMNSLAYIIYTSGSTGKPKGAMLEHIGMMNHIGAKVNDLGLTGESIVAQNASHTFDISLWQFFVALTLGGRTIIYSHQLIMEPGKFIEGILKDQINILEVVPSYLSVMYNALEERNWPLLPVKYLLVTGEEVKPHLVRKWFQYYPGTRVVNAYGPTEASDDITHFIMDKPPQYERIPIGRSLQNLNIYIVDENMKLCPPGIQGEICVSGVGVGRGYLNEIEKTRGTFIQDPFIGEEGVRLYKTGDLGFHRPDGVIQFLGRRDHQVKIRGFRIELGEIESVLLNVEGINEAVVIDRKSNSGDKYLCAYIIGQGNLNIQQVKANLAKHLPDYSVPTFFVKLDRLPLTPNGKIDRKVLPDPMEGLKPIPFISQDMMKNIVVPQPKKSVLTTGDETGGTEEEQLTEVEKERIVFGFNETATTYPEDKTFYQLFQEQVERTPEKVVYIFESEKITYKELNRRANLTARILRERGVHIDSIVGLMVDRSIEAIIGLLGILKAGGAYLPVDVQYPVERFQYMLKDSHTTLLVINKNVPYQYSGPTIVLSEILHHGEPIPNPVPTSTDTDPAYVIYTSGSTGKPKGVIVEHRPIVNFACSMIDTLGFRPEDSILSLSTLAFDMVGTELFPPLIHGMTVIIGNSEEQMYSDATATLVEREKITVLQVTPSNMQQLIEDKRNIPHLNSVRLLLVGAEPFPESLLIELRKLSQWTIFNLYGPTETTTWSTSKDVTGNTGLNVGKPISNTQVYILGVHNRVRPLGTPGELCIGGDGTARGYLNNPQHTHEKFLQNPFKKGKRMYRTGDIARWNQDGEIEFMGREDHQVQISGFRVELGEIENILMKHQDIKQAVVIAKETKGKKVLYAYVVSIMELMESDIREYLSGKLPLFMFPTFFARVEKMPLNPNGKLNRKLLQAIDLDFTTDSNYEAPRNPVEKVLSEIWSQVLGKKQVGINENFFMIGGDSIKTIQIAARINKAGYKVQVQDIFRNPTISGLSPLLSPLLKNNRPLEPHSVVIGVLPLTPIQEEFFKTSRIDSHHFNQAVMLLSRKGFDENTIKKVFSKLQQHHDALRMTYREEDRKVIQTCNGPEHPLWLQVFDLRRETGDVMDLIQNKANHIQSSIDLEKGPLMKLGLFRLHDGDRLLIVIHHLVIDGISWRILFEDFDTLMAQASNDKPLELPMKTASFSQWAKTLHQYANDQLFLKEKTYWQELDAAATAIPMIEKDFEDNGGTEENYVRDTLDKSFHISESHTDALLNKVNNAFGTRINDILLVALGLAIKEIWRQNRVLIALEGHGREPLTTTEEIDISRTVGWFTSIYPVIIDLPQEGDLSRQVIQTKEMLRRIPQKGIGYSILKHLTREPHRAAFKAEPQISFNYLGQFDADVERTFIEIAREPMGHSVSLDALRRYEIDIAGMIANKKLVLTVSYNKRHFKADTMESFSNQYKSELIRVISHCAQQITPRLTPSDLFYKELSLDELDRLTEQYPLKDVLPLAPMQEGFYFLAVSEEHSSAYFQQMAYRLKGNLNILWVENSLNRLLERYEILRAAFVHEDFHRPLQLILRERKVDFYFKDIRNLEDREHKIAYVEVFREKDRRRSFDLARDVLIRVSVLRIENNEYEFIWSFQHIIMDGWCGTILVSDFMEIYNSFLQNRPPALPPVKSYRTYLQWLDRQDHEKSRNFWKDYLAGYDQVASISMLKSANGNPREYKIEKISFTLEQEENHRLMQLAGKNKVTVNTFMQTIWGLMVGKYNGKNDVVFASVVSGRPPEIEDVESIVGIFINTVPVRITFDDEIPFNQLLRKIQDKSIDCEPYHHYPLSAIQAQSALKHNLIDYIVAFENFPLGEQIEKMVNTGNENNPKNRLELELSNFEAFGQVNYDFCLLFLPGQDNLTVRMVYNGNIYEKSSIQQLAAHYRELIDTTIIEETIKVGDLILSHHLAAGEARFSQEEYRAFEI